MKAIARATPAIDKPRIVGNEIPVSGSVAGVLVAVVVLVGAEVEDVGTLD